MWLKTDTCMGVCQFFWARVRAPPKSTPMVVFLDDVNEVYIREYPVTSSGYSVTVITLTVPVPTGFI